MDDIFKKPTVDDDLPVFEDPNISYLQYLEGRGAKHADMLSPEGLQLQSEYLHALGDNHHPIDVARRISINPFAVPRDRLAACKLILEYTARKIPAQMEVTTKNGAPLAVNPDSLKNLSVEELSTLLDLLDKANKE